MRLSGFEIGEEIGGGSGHCFRRARRASDGRFVLLRASDNGAAALFERELEICRDLDVDGILKPLDLVEGRGGPVLVLADAPGVPLDCVLCRRGGPLPLATALALGARLAGILSALHRRDLVHRDLRPANVVYDEDSGRVSLTGLGRASRVPREAWRMRAPDRLEGDPAYLAPEATGRLARQLDYRADLYSLGVVLFEMLTGRPPFDDADPLALVHAHIAREPPDPGALSCAGAPSGRPCAGVPSARPCAGAPKERRRSLPVAVSGVVGKLLAKAAEDRYQSGLGLAHDLERCLADLEGGDQIRPFEPGERDLPERFELSQKLFGREAELHWLEEALSAAATGSSLVRLVAGYPGVGKTSLIEEVRGSVLRRRGLFADSTFDPGSSAAPYHGILAALRSLVLQKLGTKREELEAWGQVLEAELGSHLGVVTEALPELLRVVGEPPAVPEVPPENAGNRFCGCVGRFLATLAREDRQGANAPSVVLFLDDLQWVDPASLELLESLLTGDGGVFLLLGAYRDSEVGDDHPLARAVAELDRRGVDVDTLRLTPLAEPAVRQLVAETLHLPSPEAAPLAEVVYRKTAGNPFFARTFLNALHQRRLLRFTAEPSTHSPEASPRWSWDLEAITSLEATENVVELVARQLTELPAASRRTVAVASVLGKEFDVGTLAAVRGAGASPACPHDVAAAPLRGDESSPAPRRGDTEEILIEACRQGLMVQVGESPSGDRGEETQRYAFVHDRVREGAYELLGEEERAGVHLRIGRLLRDRAATGGTEESPRDVFEIVDHLNRTAHLVTDPPELQELVRLNAEAGRRARGSGAFRAALAYLSLPSRSWTTRPPGPTSIPGTRSTSSPGSSMPKPPRRRRWPATSRPPRGWPGH